MVEKNKIIFIRHIKKYINFCTLIQNVCVNDKRNKSHQQHILMSLNNNNNNDNNPNKNSSNIHTPASSY